MTKSETNDTLAFYRDNAATYAARERKPPTARLEAFMRRLSPGAAVLDLGCGGGHDSLILLEHGFDVTACDGSADLAREAELRIGRKVEVTRFQEIVWEERFDGIWAEASLLHVPRAELADVLTRIRRTLKPGGLLQASFKAGETEGHDRFGRYFNYPSAEWLHGRFEDARWSDIEISEADGSGYDGEPTRWLHVAAIRSA
ncbi:class I SAM-dependent methyltransferase [Ensifer adhaerens]|uniref:class I SAM-dependent methyltransferase n=1 Tax=Ensifer adhaerens TaxID=106592 RepID=UPI001CBA8DFA|nr:class I SAM-dependent methyltransferase [Ensifer adhaerens]MBZ7922303.1 class I SAM-dependent methyltransferase [Ensifer adhaerens]UAX90941.1 class I SAM-dependent methyltransferase [Ensifer adhaerens]UAX98570.1 class I SAM-dependent methyltransferase [Ensifer adhaerens]UAY05951.1 class I SAM-dependent methyltransferase [Ensifer adhaerens]